MREKQLAPRDSFGSLACIEPFPSHWPGYDSVWMEQQCLPQATENRSDCLWQGNDSQALSKHIRALITLSIIA